jgi:prepilin-type N-terminal cleavage/methylation domain-containing protein
MNSHIVRSHAGFTLIELLLVVGVIGILASIVITAINPNKQLADSRNARRRADVSAILNAVYQYVIDNQGNLPGSGSVAIDTTIRNICVGKGKACAKYTNGVAGDRISLDILTGSYIVRLPVDPLVIAGSTSTAYTVQKTGNGRVTIAAPFAEQGVTISVSR